MMGLFGRKKKEKEVTQEEKKLESSINDKGIAFFKCPYCYTTLFQGYYMTVKVEQIKECPYCGGKLVIRR